jgi:hypothetical protein
MRLDRGTGAVDYLAVVVVIAAILAAIAVSGIAERVADGAEAAICRILIVAGIEPNTCQLPPRTPGAHQAISDPDEPTHSCVVRNERQYLEETVTFPVRYLDVRTNSRGTVALKRGIEPGGKQISEVEDYTWGEGAAATPSIRKSTIDSDAPTGPQETRGPDFGAWGGISITNGKVYRFDDEKEARKFRDDLQDHRIGGPVKFTLRTNPLTGWAVWLAGKLPLVGDGIDEFMGGSEPDRKPSAEYLEGGLTGGFNGDLPLGNIAAAPFKGRGWLVDGQLKDNETGETTVYFRDSAEGEAGLQFDMANVWKKLPVGFRERVARGLDDDLDAVLAVIETQLKGEFGKDVAMSPDQRDELKKALKINPDVGVNFKGRIGAQYALTQDKNGNPVKFTKTDWKQLIFYLRVGGKTGGTVRNEKLTGSGNAQWSPLAHRWETEKTLDLEDARDLQAAQDFFGKDAGDLVEKSVNPFTRWSGRGGLDEYFDQGGGTMARYTYFTDAASGKMTGNGERSTTVPKSDTKQKKTKRKYGLLEIGAEEETNDLAAAEYFKPGQGWVRWRRCAG